MPGCVAGLILARWLHNRLITAGAVPANLPLRPGPVPPLAAMVLTTAAAWVAGRIAGRRAARIRPTAALAEAAAPPVRLGRGHAVIGVLLLLVGVVLLMVLRGLHTPAAATPVALLTSLIWVGALTLLGVPILRLAGTALSATLSSSPAAAGYLAALNLRTDARRYASVAMPLLLAISQACTILFMQTSITHAAQQQVTAATHADYLLSATKPGMPPDVAAAARNTPGVDTATQIIRTTARGTDLTNYSVQGLTPIGLSRTLDLAVQVGSVRALSAGTAAVSTTTSRRSGAGVGDQLRLYLGDGTPLTLTVIAVYARGLGFSDITLTRDLIAAHVDDPLDDIVLVRGTTGLTDSLESAVRPYTNVHVAAGTQLPAVSGKNTSTAIQYLLLILIVGFAAIGVINTLIMSTADRAQQFAALRLTGATPSQILAMSQCESALLWIFGAAFGTAISLATLAAYSFGLAQSGPHIPALPYFAIVGGAAALALGTTSLATRTALKAAPVNAITARE